MKLFCYMDTDTFVAADEADAWAALLETHGGTRDDFDGGMEEVPSDKRLTIWCDDNGHPSDGGTKATRTAADWAAREPRGMLCSTEY